MQFGKIKKLNPRDIWPKEAKDFTPWLADNIGELGEALGMELELNDMEAAVGDFSLDLLAKDLGTGHTVIIENQLTQTDHDHLGKLLTYAAGFSASTVVWVAEVIRDEHRQALEWLNQRTDEDTQFFGVVIDVFKIDDSKPAFSFKPVVSPSEWQKSKKRQASGTVSAKGEMYSKYFQTLIDELREEYKFTNAKIGQPQNWYSFSSGVSGITFGAVFVQGSKARTELYIDVGEGDKNKALFDWLYDQREEIHSKLGKELEWERLDDKRASRLAVYRDGAIQSNEEELKQIKAWHIENLVNFKKVLTPLLKKGLKANATLHTMTPSVVS
ncbi:MAG: DUF4268 domain-containing protein [Deltaproteobacteria bacterium]|nr:DUF4268 domain-containing protein [Deltaproteobacteria bacterium]